MGIKLTDLHPAWIDLPDEGRHGLGLLFDCMVGEHNGKPCYIKNIILFKNPLDGGEPFPGESRAILLKLYPDEEERYDLRGCGTSRWQRTGETFETLSMTPSVDAHSCGHYTLTNGVFA